jgi:FlgD Ig-like domain
VPSSPLVRSVYGLLVVATIAAFFVTQRLKSDEPVVLRFAVSAYAISPNGDGVADISKVGFDLSEPADVSFAVIDDRGDEVRTLVESRELEGDEKHRFVWDGKDDSGRPVADGDYRLEVSLRDQGRTLDSAKEIRVDLTPPRVRLAFARPNLVTPDFPGTLPVEIAYRGPRNANPEYRVFRTDGGEPRVVLRFRGSDTKSAFWDGRVRGPLAPDGNYAFSVRVRDRAGNAGQGPPLESGPTAATALPGTGVMVRRLTLRGPAGVVDAGDVARFQVGPRGRRFRFALTRLGSPKVLRKGARRGRNFRVGIPPKADTGVYVLRVKAGQDRASVPVAVQAGAAGGRPLVVLPAITWQALNEEDDDFDGFGDTLLNARSVGLARPYLGGLAPLFRRETAPLLRFLDRANVGYDLTSDLALARGEGPSLDEASGVAVAGSARWLPVQVNLDLREYVERGGKLASFGSDAFRRRVHVADRSLDDPSKPSPRNVFGEAVTPGKAEEAPMNVIDDELGLFAATDGLVGLFSSFEQSQRLPRGTEVLSSAGRDDDTPAFVAYRLGNGTVIRVGAPGWSDALEGVNEDDEVGEVTEAIFEELGE